MLVVEFERQAVESKLTALLKIQCFFFFVLKFQFTKLTFIFGHQNQIQFHIPFKSKFKSRFNSKSEYYTQRRETMIREVSGSCVETLMAEIVSSYCNGIYANKPELAAPRIEAIGFQVGHRLSERQVCVTLYLHVYYRYE